MPGLHTRFKFVHCHEGLEFRHQYLPLPGFPNGHPLLKPIVHAGLEPELLRKAHAHFGGLIRTHIEKMKRRRRKIAQRWAKRKACDLRRAAKARETVELLGSREDEVGRCDGTLVGAIVD